MDKLDPLTLTDVDSDVKGDAFEYFLKESAATKNDLGEYFTPRHIVKTMVKLVNPQIGEKIYDPFCGTGGFLIESFRHIWNTMPRNNTTIDMLKKETVFGNEITNTARITKMNMILAGDGHSNIHMKDSIANPVDGMNNEGYDVVITNMPYSQKTKYGNLYDMPSNNGDSICVQHCMKAINTTAENGRMALVVPEGFLFRKDLSKTRELLLKNCDLQSIISLPQGVFLPYTGVKTNILFANKVNQKTKTSEKRKDFWYFVVKSDGYTLDNHRRKLDSGSDLDKYQEYRKLDSDQQREMFEVGFERVLLDKVRENSFDLLGSRYREQKVVLTKWEMVPLGDLFISMKNGLNVNQTDIAGKYRVSRIQSISDGVFDINKTKWTDDDVQEEHFLQKGDILLSHINSFEHLAKTAIFNNGYTDRVVHGANLIRLIPNVGKISPEFAKYILKSVSFVETAKLFAQRAVNQASIRVSDLRSIKIPLPPIEVQQQIVDEMSNYQRIIDGARAVVESYKPVIPSKIIGEVMRLEDIATFRPSKDEVKTLDDETVISFVPMADLNAYDISFMPKDEKSISEVYTGYTYFKDNDVLLAKITPCFENGKSGIARNLTNGIGFGSTEYIVIRAKTEIAYPEWIYYHINSQAFLKQGKGAMTGTGGQQRVDINFVKNYSIVVPPLDEQRRILDEIATEQTLVSSNKKLTEVFREKMENKINEIWGE